MPGPTRTGTPVSAGQASGTPVASPLVVTVTIPANKTGVLVFSYVNSASGVTSITNGGTWTKKVTSTDPLGTALQGCEIWVTGAGASASAASVSVAFSGTPEALEVNVGCYDSVLGFGNTGTNGSGAGTAANPNATLTTQDSNNYVVLGVCKWTTAAFSAGSCAVYTDGSQSGSTDIRGALADAAVATPQSFLASLTVAAEEWAAAALELRSTSITISDPPHDKTVVVGATANFTITASGTGTLHYQWKLNGSNVGSDSSSYTTDAALASDNASLVTCVVTDDLSSLTSAGAYWLVVGSAPLWLIKA